jgi:acylphosphatase
MKRAHVYISGDVTGVGYRSWTVRTACSLGLTGWVRNVGKDVEAVFEGSEEKVKEMINQCQAGPEVAWVQKVDVKWGKATGEFNEFLTYFTS